MENGHGAIMKPKVKPSQATVRGRIKLAIQEHVLPAFDGGEPFTIQDVLKQAKRTKVRGSYWTVLALLDAQTKAGAYEKAKGHKQGKPFMYRRIG